jgi:hypothetical protein
VNARALLCVVALLASSTALAGPRPKPAPNKADPPADKAPAPAGVDKKPARPPGGDKRRIVGILDVRVDGVPKETAAQFQANLEKQLDSRSYWLAPRSRVHEMMANSTRWTEGCLVGPCLHEIRVQTRADVVLLAAISGSDTSFGYVVTLMRTDTGRVLSQAAERCDVCTVSEALTNATLAAVRLLTEVPDELPDETADLRAAAARDGAAKDGAHTRTMRRHRNVGLATLLTGLAVAGAGTALYFAKDRPDYALATAAVGGGLSLGGVIALTF